MTTQEAYEQMVEHFSRPDAKLAQHGPGESCYYRLNEDRYSDVKCAVGCLIPNTLYDPNWEDQGITYEILKEAGLLSVDGIFLRHAQAQHDGVPDGSVSTFLTGLHKLAQKNGLDVIA